MRERDVEEEEEEEEEKEVEEEEEEEDSTPYLSHVVHPGLDRSNPRSFQNVKNPACILEPDPTELDPGPRRHVSTPDFVAVGRDAFAQSTELLRR